MSAYDEISWQTLTPEEKNRQLFRKQKALLDTFLSHGAIFEAQYWKSYYDLKAKMGIEEPEENAKT